MDQRLSEFLGARRGKYRLITHAGVVTAQEQAAASHTSGWSWAKVVIVKERDGFVMAVLPACCVLDLNRLKGLIGHGEIRLATAEEIGGVVPDCAPGAIPPFGALYGLRVFVDSALINRPEITMPAGDLATAIRMRSAEFRRLGDFKEGDFVVAEAMMSPMRESGRRRASIPRWRQRQGGARVERVTGRRGAR
ncbi:MAG TPA: YbaK/EbsC family protein [Methylomirabilota bacterium]|nr:YbaK/EbsC family protein [Methylomirabilota bacterium]